MYRTLFVALFSIPSFVAESIAFSLSLAVATSLSVADDHCVGGCTSCFFSRWFTLCHLRSHCRATFTMCRCVAAHAVLLCRCVAAHAVSLCRSAAAHMLCRCVAVSPLTLCRCVAVSLCRSVCRCGRRCIASAAVSQTIVTCQEKTLLLLDTDPLIAKLKR